MSDYKDDEGMDVSEWVFTRPTEIERIKYLEYNEGDVYCRARIIFKGDRQSEFDTVYDSRIAWLKVELEALKRGIQVVRWT